MKVKRWRVLHFSEGRQRIEVSNSTALTADEKYCILHRIEIFYTDKYININ